MIIGNGATLINSGKRPYRAWLFTCNGDHLYWFGFVPPVDTLQVIANSYGGFVIGGLYATTEAPNKIKATIWNREYKVRNRERVKA